MDENKLWYKGMATEHMVQCHNMMDRVQQGGMTRQEIRNHLSMAAGELNEAGAYLNKFFKDVPPHGKAYWRQLIEAYEHYHARWTDIMEEWWVDFHLEDMWTPQ